MCARDSCISADLEDSREHGLKNKDNPLAPLPTRLTLHFSLAIAKVAQKQGRQRWGGEEAQHIDKHHCAEIVSCCANKE